MKEHPYPYDPVVIGGTRVGEILPFHSGMGKSMISKINKGDVLYNDGIMTATVIDFYNGQMYIDIRFSEEDSDCITWSIYSDGSFGPDDVLVFDGIEDFKSYTALVEHCVRVHSKLMESMK